MTVCLSSGAFSAYFMPIFRRRRIFCINTQVKIIQVGGYVTPATLRQYEGVCVVVVVFLCVWGGYACLFFCFVFYVKVFILSSSLFLAAHPSTLVNIFLM